MMETAFYAIKAGLFRIDASLRDLREGQIKNAPDEIYRAHFAGILHPGRMISHRIYEKGLAGFLMRRLYLISLQNSWRVLEPSLLLKRGTVAV